MTTPTSSVVFDFKLFFDIAEDHATQGLKSMITNGLNSQEEAQLRVAITCAYFSGLGGAKQHLTQQDSYLLQGSLGNTYTEVHDAFANLDLAHQKVAVLLEELRDLHMTASYLDIHPAPEAQARTALVVIIMLQQQLASIP